MSIVRSQKTEGFTVMSNSHLKDRSISLKAKGLLSLILSLPDGWVYTIKGLATLNSDGLDSTRAALKNLEDHGYVVRRQLYDKRGRFAKCEYTVYERPQRSSPPTGSPSSEKPTTLSAIDSKSTTSPSPFLPLVIVPKGRTSITASRSIISV